MWYVVADRMPVILGDNASVNIWLNDASVKLEEITAPYEGADLVSLRYALCCRYIQNLLYDGTSTTVRQDGVCLGLNPGTAGHCAHLLCNGVGVPYCHISAGGVSHLSWIVGPCLLWLIQEGTCFTERFFYKTTISIRCQSAEKISSDKILVHKLNIVCSVNPEKAAFQALDKLLFLLRYILVKS